MQDNESSLMLIVSPTKEEETSIVEPTFEKIMACRRKIKQLRKELDQEERLLNEYRLQRDKVFTCDLEDEQDDNEASR